MNIFRFFNHSAEKDFARSLVERLLKELPPRLMEQHHKVLSVNKITRLLERTGQLATSYQQEHGLGVMKRAVLANNFKWQLKSSGYPDDFVDVATESLVVALTKAADLPKAKP